MTGSLVSVEDGKAQYGSVTSEVISIFRPISQLGDTVAKLLAIHAQRQELKVQDAAHRRDTDRLRALDKLQASTLQEASRLAARTELRRLELTYLEGVETARLQAEVGLAGIRMQGAARLAEIEAVAAHAHRTIEAQLSLGLAALAARQQEQHERSQAAHREHKLLDRRQRVIETAVQKTSARMSRTTSREELALLLPSLHVLTETLTRVAQPAASTDWALLTSLRSATQ